MFKHLFLCRQFRLNGLHQIKIANNTIGNMIVRKPNSNSNSPQGEMVNHMIGNIPNLHAFASTSELKTLVYNPNEETTIIKDKYQLESDVIYSFENLKLIKGALLTVAKYNSEANQNNGILRIKCTHLTLEDDTKITVNGEGIIVMKICGAKVTVIQEYRKNQGQIIVVEVMIQLVWLVVVDMVQMK